MTATKLDRLATAHGIGLTRPAVEAREVAVSDETKRKLLAAIHAGGTEAPKSYLPLHLEQERVWGISLQLYELRTERNWGIGDFADLAEFSLLAGKLKADFVGLNPLHAPFMAAPERCSPYEPSSRQFLNPLYIAVDQVKGFFGSAALNRKLEKLRHATLIDYTAVASVKLAALRNLWRRRKSWPAAEIRALEDFQDLGGEALWRHALFEALSERMTKQGNGAGWTAWPAEFQDPESEIVARFARDHRASVEFHIWLQYIAHNQLLQAADTAKKAGLRIGLYLDLAVGEALDGSGTWSDRDAYIWGASIGSPPDPWAVDGQDWRLAALQPATIAVGRGAPFRKLLDAAMKYAGAIRIDHAAALRRLFLVPFDASPTEGAYVSYPENQLLAVLSERSEAHKCLVIGEDLGLIPEGLRETLQQSQILSYRILSYEKTKQRFIAPSRYPTLALACVSTHDHQTMNGWWRAKDIEMRQEHGLIPKEAAAEQFEERDRDRTALRRAFKAEGITLPQEKAVGDAAFVEELVAGAYRYLAKSSSQLLAARLADMVDEPRPTNVPGTSDTYPNWKPRLSVSLDKLETSPLFMRVVQEIKAERARSSG